MSRYSICLHAVRATTRHRPLRPIGLLPYLPEDEIVISLTQALAKIRLPVIPTPSLWTSITFSIVGLSYSAEHFRVTHC